MNRAYLPVPSILEGARLSRVPDPEALMRKIRADFAMNPLLFKTLGEVNRAYSHSIRAYDEKEQNVVVKFCGVDRPSMKGILPSLTRENMSAAFHGARTNDYERFFKLYDTMVKEETLRPSGYWLVPIRHYGLVILGQDGTELQTQAKRVYLVMERLDALDANSLKCGYFEGITRAEAELAENVGKLREEAWNALGLKIRVPQADNPIIIGNTNPTDFNAGKWVFAMPHDYL